MMVYFQLQNYPAGRWWEIASSGEFLGNSFYVFFSMITKKTLSLRAILRFNGQHLTRLIPWALIATFLYYYTQWHITSCRRALNSHPFILKYNEWKGKPEPMLRISIS